MVSTPQSQKDSSTTTTTMTLNTKSKPAPLRPINLLRGWPAPSLLPKTQLAAAAAAILSTPETSTSALQYGPDPGFLPLRIGLAKFLTRFYAPGIDEAESDTESLRNEGIKSPHPQSLWWDDNNNNTAAECAGTKEDDYWDRKPDAGRICITGGASQSIANVLASFTDPVFTRAAWVVAPCYHLVCPIFADAGFGGRMKAAPEDEDGLDVKELERRILAFEKEERFVVEGEPFKKVGSERKLYRYIIYVVPTCSNPSGKTMPTNRRKHLLALARRHNALIICDDVYDFLQWPSNVDAIPRISDLDYLVEDDGGFGNAISNGTFSKLAGPGLRTGWVEGRRAFIQGLSQTGATRSGGAPSQFCAAMMSWMLEKGELESHVNEVVRPALRRRHAVMMAAVREYILPLGAKVRESSLTKEDVYGGYFIWITLPRGYSSARVVTRVAKEEENLMIGGGEMFEVAGDENGARFDGNIRLCFAWESEEGLVEGVKRLANVLKRISVDRDFYDRKGRGVLHVADHM